jgi:hypothetical protein
MSKKMLWAIKDTVDAYQGGQRELAELLGINANSFRRKVNPNDLESHLTASELARLMAVTNDYRVLQVLSEEADCIMVPQDERINDADSAIMRELYAMQRGSDGEANIRQWLSRIDVSKGDLRKTIHGMTRRLLTLAEQIDG